MKKGLKKRSNFVYKDMGFRVQIEMESPKTRAGVLDLFCFDRGTVTVSGITIIRPIALILPSLTQKRESTPQAKDECQREDAQASLSEGESEGVRFQVSLGQTEDQANLETKKKTYCNYEREQMLSHQTILTDCLCRPYATILLLL